MVNPNDPQSPIQSGKKGPSCWVIGGLSCIALMVMVVVFLAFIMLGTSSGRKFSTELASDAKSSMEIPKSMYQMSDIRGAVIRYQRKNNRYPVSISELYPIYLARKQELHSALDPNTNPDHVTFAYTEPAVNAPPSTIILKMRWDYVFKDRGEESHTAVVLTETLGGVMTQTQYVDGIERGRSSYDGGQDDD